MFPVDDVETKRSTFLPFHLPDIGQEEVQSVTETLLSGWITTGPKTKRFEEEFVRYLGVGHAIAVNSCTAALHLALEAIGVTEGDEVIVPTLTFAATAEVVLYLRARPVLVDSSEDTLNMDPEEVAKAVTPKTKAIIVVHYAGHPCDMDPILEIARRHNLKVIEDAAHVMPAQYKGRNVGDLGDIGAFSFYATKPITTAEGGMITTRDAALAERMRIMSLHGISRDAWKRYTAEGSWYYEIHSPGYKYNMSDVAAAIGLEQFKKRDRFLKTREDIVRLYNEAFSDLSELILPTVRPDVISSWHLYVLRLKLENLKITRAQFIEQMKEARIGTSVHFIPLHNHPYYRESYGYKPRDFPRAQRAYESMVSLPIYPKMTARDVQDVIQAVRRIVRDNRR